MNVRRRVFGWSAALTLVLVISVVTSAAIGPVRIEFLTVAKSILNAISTPTGVTVESVSLPIVGWMTPIPSLEYAPVFTFDVPASRETIVLQIRLPRIALAATVGVALAMAGAVMQGFFRNPMADPSIIGVSSGAAVGAVATIAFPLAVPVGLQPAAFLGALAAAFGVYLIANDSGRTPVATLLLAGVAVQTLLGAAVSYMLLHAGESMRQAVYWLMGHLHASTWAEVELTLPLAVLAFAVLFAYARDLNVLLLGEVDAQTLGIDVERTKRILLALSSVMTAAAVAVAGIIGFVGLIVPHVMRLLVGPDHRVLLPTSALAGAAFLVATDTLARSGPAEVPVGIVTAALGAPFFLYLLRTREVHEL